MTAIQRHLQEISRVEKELKNATGYRRKDLQKYLNRLWAEYREYKRLTRK